MPDTTPAPQPPAPAPAPPPDEAVVLLDYAQVLGEVRPKGKVLLLPAAEAQRLIAAGAARAATPTDRAIAGVL